MYFRNTILSEKSPKNASRMILLNNPLFIVNTNKVDHFTVCYKCRTTQREVCAIDKHI